MNSQIATESMNYGLSVCSLRKQTERLEIKKVERVCHMKENYSNEHTRNINLGQRLKTFKGDNFFSFPNFA